MTRRLEPFERYLEESRRVLEVAKRYREAQRTEADRLAAQIRAKRRRKPPEAGIAVPAVPPQGPLPKSGGAEAPLEFD